MPAHLDTTCPCTADISSKLTLTAAWNGISETKMGRNRHTNVRDLFQECSSEQADNGRHALDLASCNDHRDDIDGTSLHHRISQLPKVDISVDLIGQRAGNTTRF